MKFIKILSVAALSLVFLQSKAQNEPPKGFTEGVVVLADNSTVSGYVKENMRKNASVTFISEDQKKSTYQGTDILTLTIGNENYICLKGDFFKTICTGKICFLQKLSDASDKLTYNGAEAVFASGTDGKPGDYFIYETISKELKHVTKKNLADVAAASFAGCNAAIEKSKAITGDLSLLKDAVEVFNAKSTN
jgi:hypothetical protein